MDFEATHRLRLCGAAGRWAASYCGVKGQGDMLVEAAGGEGDLRQREVVLGAGQRGVEHQDVVLRGAET